MDGRTSAPSDRDALKAGVAHNDNTQSASVAGSDEAAASLSAPAKLGRFAWLLYTEMFSRWQDRLITRGIKDMPPADRMPRRGAPLPPAFKA